MNPYRAPLAIYVVWYPEYNDNNVLVGKGKELADFLFSSFNRDISNPISRGIGIPVFFRYQPPEGQQYPIPISKADSKKSVVVLLIDHEFVNNWENYTEQILAAWEESDEDLHRVIPVALEETAYNVSSKVETLNFINLHRFPEKKQKDELLTNVTHELCRLLYNEPRISEADHSNEERPITLFLSYAREGGEEITDKIKSYIDKEIALRTFMDKRDIPKGRKFDQVLAKNISQATLLIVLTDAYSSREWCRWEVLKAKRNDRPVVVIDALTRQEARSFPYLGNSPVIRFEELKTAKEVLTPILTEDQLKKLEEAEQKLTEELLKKILHIVLFEILRYEYSKLLLRSQLNQYEEDKKSYKILGSPPELLTLVGKAFEKEAKDRHVIYPDPPLTNEERELLSELEGYYFFTPTTLAAL
ncbi:toll/interleukin-1 receptor domain-containing protein [Paraflavisolibacter sp. H34]|uniref:toll/interleukin-1 receptor domain-containing protein n=1 Tax=Huijunlia imazamoxiresistens TaxID=3127457 RepID=UPI003018BA0F